MSIKKSILLVSLHSALKETQNEPFTPENLVSSALFVDFSEAKLSYLDVLNFIWSNVAVLIIFDESGLQKNY